MSECVAIEVEGRLDPSTCGCEDCTDQIYDDINADVESGAVSDDEAHDQIVQFEQFGVLPS